jgi:YidC/Oxa1 family membrane protein insertase
VEQPGARRGRMRRLGPVAVAVVLVLGLGVAFAACGAVGPSPSAGSSPTASVPASPGPSASAGPSASPAPTASHLPPAAVPLRPASPGANPVDLLAWLFTPIFWLLFNALVVIDLAIEAVLGQKNIAIAIVVLTIIIRALLVPPFRHQIVSQRRMQLVMPELREIQRRYKGDRAKALEAQQRFYRERGISPTSGCLPLLLQFMLLIPMYSVISQGLTNFNPQAMTPIQLGCDPAPIVDASGHVTNPCLNPVAFGIDWSRPEILFSVFGFGVSGLAILSAILQLIQSRMTLPPPDPTNTDPNVRLQRQMVLFLPLISIAYGGILPAGLFVYWITTTIFSIIQQYLIIGWGSMFPIFGWYPDFARNHRPRFPVEVPAPNPLPDGARSVAAAGPIDRTLSAQRTIRPSRGRGRRGRRR